MEILITIVTTMGVAFLIMVIHPEWQKSAAAVRKVFKSFLKKPFELFTFTSLCIILAGIIKLAFLQG